jgi:hypothetical protein
MLNRGKKVVQNILSYFCIFQKTAQSKQSPSGLKFAQSGHPARNAHLTTGFDPLTIMNVKGVCGVQKCSFAT